MNLFAKIICQVITIGPYQSFMLFGVLLLREPQQEKRKLMAYSSLIF